MLAYHFVHGGKRSMAAIMRQGRLLPAAYHIVPKMMMESCQHDAGMDAMLAPNGAVMHAIKDAVRRESEAVAKLQAQEDIHPSVHKTNLTCFDFLALDHNCVFLSLANWVWFGKRAKPNGFIFNAEAMLMEKRAELRTSDLLVWYGAAILEADRTYGGEHEDYMVTDVAKRLGRAFDDIARDYILHSAEAVKWLRAAREKDLRVAELTVCGPLDLRLADEVWIEGVQQ